MYINDNFITGVVIVVISLYIIDKILLHFFGMRWRITSKVQREMDDWQKEETARNVLIAQIFNKLSKKDKIKFEDVLKKIKQG